MGFVTTFLTGEIYSSTVILADMVTSRACLRSVSRVNVDYTYPCFMGFVFNKPLELPESPTTMLISKLFADVCPLSNMS
jgi:hypothetical protein